MARLTNGELILCTCQTQYREFFWVYCLFAHACSYLKMNVHQHPVTLSRATSRASHRSRNSSLSRAQSLVKKNIELIDLKPADVLIERFVAWKVIVKQLTSYFEVGYHF